MKLTGDLKKQVEMAESKDEISSIKLTVNDIVKQLSRFVSFEGISEGFFPGLGLLTLLTGFLSIYANRAKREKHMYSHNINYTNIKPHSRFYGSYNLTRKNIGE